MESNDMSAMLLSPRSMTMSHHQPTGFREMAARAWAILEENTIVPEPAGDHVLVVSTEPPDLIPLEVSRVVDKVTQEITEKINELLSYRDNLRETISIYRKVKIPDQINSHHDLLQKGIEELMKSYAPIWKENLNINQRQSIYIIQMEWTARPEYTGMINISVSRTECNVVHCVYFPNG